MKAKAFTKYFALILASFLMFSLSACGAEGSNSGKGPSGESPEIDLEGYDFQLVTTIDLDNFSYDYTKGTVREDLVLARIEDMKTRLNIEFTPMKSNIDALLAAAASGKTIGEAGRLYSNTFYNSMIKAGGMFDLSEVSDIIDFSDWNKWGTPYQNEIGMSDGKHYLISPHAWPDILPQTTSCIFFNETMVVDSGIPDLRSMLEQKTWTWDNFLTLISDWTTEEGENSLYGTVASAWKQIIPRMAFFSNGGRVAFYDEEGSLHSDIEGEIGIQALDFAKKLMTDYKYCFFGGNYFYGHDWSDYLQPFLDGQCYTVIGHSRAAVTDIAKGKVKFGLLPFPVGPNGSFTEFPVNVESDYCYGIFSMADNPVSAAIVFSEFFEPFEEYPDRQALIDELTMNCFYDRRDAEMFYKLSENVDYSYWTDNGEVFWNGAASDLASKSPSQIIESYMPSFKKIIEEFIAPNRAVLEQEVQAGSSSK